ncbi:ABC transporter permease [Mangrovicoccus sp. HB161399]|uniref:ABC transporter permease n=1 Tax=Mangrovicoccus sp. HB161399 TaxID=2720392 RepID=UPI00155776B3|nr:ABC transporter permease [Mangrovicoccus sp. HB161399]
MLAAKSARGLVAPAVILTAGVFLAPFLLLLAMSLWSQPPGSLMLDVTPTGENYRRITTDAYYMGGLARTIWLSLATTAICAVLSLPLAWWIVRRAGRFRGLILAVVLIPMVCGALLPTLGIVNLIGPLGVLNGTLKSLGLIERSWKLLGTQAGILIGLVHAFLPLMVLPLVASMDRLPRDAEGAAMSLGARRRAVWTRIILPLCAPGLLAGSALVFCATLTAFVTPLILGQGKIPTFATMAYQQASLVLDWPFASALAVVMLAILAAIGALGWAVRQALPGAAR